MGLKVNQTVKWRSTATETKWFYGRIVSLDDKKYAIVVDDAKRMYPQFVSIDRLMNSQAVV